MYCIYYLKVNYTPFLQWMKSDTPRAVALKKHIGLTDTLSEDDYSKIIDKQMDKNVTFFAKMYGASCSYAKWNLTAWNAKPNGDAFLYAVSIISTVGMKNTRKIYQKFEKLV